MYLNSKHRIHFFLAAAFILLSVSLKAQGPVSAFTANKTIGCSPLQVSFTNTSTGASTYQWVFGNSNTSTLANPSTVYSTPGVYNVMLIAINGVNRDTSYSTITVVNDPVADFTANQLTGCPGVNSITFTNTSQNAVLYTWDFGDGTSSNAVNPVHTYNTSGVYTVKLIAESTFGCQNIKSKTSYITIYPSPSSQFTAPVTSSCNLTTVFNLTPTGSGATSYSWTFGDGGTSTASNPTHQYTAAGAYTVTLITTSAQGCKDTTVRPGFLTIGNTLVPSFTMSDTAGCSPLNIQFNCNVQNATSWIWNFGNGNTSTLQSPSATFTNPGNYTITLAVTTQSGCNGTVTIPGLVVVDPMPVPAFTVVQDSGCAPYSAQFVNNTTGGATYQWSFGNSTTSTSANPVGIYTAGGSYPVTLTATSPNGCVASITKNNFITVLKPSANYSATPRTGCPGTNIQFSYIGASPNIVGYYWSFGDGSTSTLQNPSHVYNAVGNNTVFLIVTNSFGCKDTVYRGSYIKIFPGNTPYVLPDTIKVCQNAAVNFIDPTPGSATWAWNFGNGNTSNLQNPSYVYSTPGVYTVTLNTTMNGGCSQLFSPFAIVQVIPYSPQPITFNIQQACKPYQVSFSTTTPNVVNYLWSFGDGQTSPLANPVHIYANAGTYNVTLTMTIGAGCVTSLSTSVTVGHPNPAQASSVDACVNTPINFTCNNTVPFTSFKWVYGDGNTSNTANATHSFTNAGTYQVYLVTTDLIGCTDSFPVSVLISNPVPDFNVSGSTHTCFGSPTTFVNTSTNSTSWLWDFGDSTTDTILNPQHTYTAAGSYTVTLTATANGCAVTKSVTNYISIEDPQVSFTNTTSGLCLPVTVQFQSVAPTAVSWLWYFGDSNTSTSPNPNYVYNAPPTDSIKLTITDQYGCSKTTAEPPIMYYKATGTADIMNGCVPQPVNFNDLSMSATSWVWDFGDGDTSHTQNPTHTYLADGIYTVTLICTFPGGCIDTVSYPSFITINTPKADFYSNSVAGCSPTQISFINTSLDAGSFTWLFGDNGSSATTNPDHIYYIPGTYSVTLIATNSNGCSDTFTRNDYISIPGTYTSFSISSLSICQHAGVNFADSSINAQSWSWNFGDGYTSAQSDPVHAYADTGSYIVTLITQDSIGCTSSYTFPNPVVIHPVPVASATVSDSVGCSTFITSFTNLSTGAATYEWNYGDGGTDTLTDPTHAFLTGGIYQTALVAITGFGCRDTYNIPTLIDVLQTPAAAFSLSDSIGCEPQLITLTNTSTLTSGATYNWQSGDGQTGTSAVFNPVYPLAGTYTPVLIITNSNGCSDTISSSILINPSPVAVAAVDISQGCEPLPVQFTNTSSGASGYIWYFGNGDSSLATNPAYTYTTNGIYQPSLVATNNFGCHHTVTVPPVDVMMTPNVSFASDTAFGCIGSTINFSNLATNIQNATYAWDFGFTTSTLPDPSIVYPVDGIFDVQLIITNANGCSDTLTNTAMIEIFDPAPPAANQVFSVSVVDDERITIIWENSGVRDLGQYILYRLDNISGAWFPVYTENNPVNSTTSVSSSYTDGGLNTLTTAYSFKLQTVDRCGNALPLDSLTAYTSINVNASKAGTNIYVQWNQYGGCSPAFYELYRQEKGTTNQQLIAVLTPGSSDYLDTTLLCPFMYEYTIRATDLCANGYGAWSDTSAAQPDNILANQQVEVTRTTVVNNTSVLTEWKPPVLFPNRVASYLIIRSTDTGSYQPLAVVVAAATSYNDTDVDVNAHNYSYHIIPVNDCQLEGLRSNEGLSILLNGHRTSYRTTLQWNAYREWDTGVDHYDIEKQQSDGSWALIKSVNNITTDTILDE